MADSYDGKRLNSPNDVVVKSDGSIWFTDPTYGIDSDLEGFQADSEIGDCHVYRIDAETGEVTIATDALVRPNGLAFSPDEQFLYVSDTGASHVKGHPAQIRVFEVVDGKSLHGGGEFATCTNGFFDGFRLDTSGRLWTSAGDGVHVYDPDGTLLGKVLVPEVVANVEFGGLKRNRLFICGTTSLYSVMVPVNGVKKV
ncbi:MAG: gluconolactonase [Thermomicrobiales bacterium]|nr:gluconolactonase [Thermomicrobiales bacterium]